MNSSQNQPKQCASDPRVWAGHPAKDRYEKEVFRTWIETALAEKALVLLRRADNRELKALTLNHAFNSYDNVWFHIDPSNLRSQAAISKIGAHFVRDEVNNLSVEGSGWKCYRMSKQNWVAQSSP